MSIAGPRPVAGGSSSRTARCPNTSTWSSPCRRRSPSSPIRTRPGLRHLFRAAAETFAPSPPTPSTWAPRSASSPCCTPGARTYPTIRICIASFPAAAIAPTVKAGSPAGQDSFFPSGCCRVCSGGCSCIIWRRRSPAGELTLLLRLAAAPRPRGILALLAPPCERRSGSSTRSGLSPGPQQVLDYVGRYTHRVAISNNRLLSMDRWQGPLSLEGLSGRQPSQQTMALDRRGVHPPLPDPCAAGGISPDPVLRLSRQSPSRAKARPLP